MVAAIDGMVVASEYGDTLTAAEAGQCAATASSVALADANCPTSSISSSAKQACRPDLKAKYKKATSKTNTTKGGSGGGAQTTDDDCCGIARTNSSLINALSIRVDGAEANISTNASNINKLLDDFIGGYVATLDDGGSDLIIAINMPFAGDITGIWGRTKNGSVTAIVEILTGVSTLVATNSLSIDTASYKFEGPTPANSFQVGHRIRIQFISASDVEGLQFQVDFRRTL